MPTGVYSDDTQLRLATARAIRGSGRFDVEAFSKIELPIFLAYELGAGRGTRAAASELAKRSVRWWNNLFARDDADYIAGGGNGAAMRIQPHVWASPNLAPETFLGDVFINAICTHGHARGFVGACWHALVLARCLHGGAIADLAEQAAELESLAGLAATVRELPLVGEIWVPPLGAADGEAARRGRREGHRRDPRRLGCHRTACRRRSERVRDVVHQIGGVEPKTRGSGTKSALLAGVVAYLFRDQPAAGLIAAANVLGSDTDTIASMAGALLGSTVAEPPPQSVMDAEYIAAEAERLAAVAAGASTAGFSYPDLLKWTPPKTQLDIVGSCNGSLAIAGLGPAETVGEATPARGRDKAVWQWLALRFGQRVLVRRRDSPRPITRDLLPTAGQAQAEPLFADTPVQVPPPAPPRQRLDLDAATRQAINSGFDPQVIGRLLIAFADSEGVDFAVAFAAIVAKARVARRGRRSEDGNSAHSR